MQKLDVIITLPNAETITVGRLVVAETNHQSGKSKGQFEYDRDYLQRHDIFPLDPISLQLREGVFDANRPGGIHAVFEDALPDSWGRELIIKNHQLPTAKRSLVHLLQYKSNYRLGALSFKPDKSSSSSESNCRSLDELLTAAKNFEQDKPHNNRELVMLFEAGSSPGGARPKTLINHEGKEWLAKFPSIKDKYDMIRLEAACLDLAKNAGLNIPHFKIVSCHGRPIILVERFDITPDNGRRHMITMKTLLRAEGYYFHSYADMANTVNKVSENPSDDLHQLYRQMVFNVCVGNTDDHLKNFTMLHDEGGWHLSPAYDLIPNTAQNFEHSLSIGYDFVKPIYKNLISVAEHFNINEDIAETIIASVTQSVNHWQDTFCNYGVPNSDIDRLERDITNRLERYTTSKTATQTSN